MIPFSIYDIFTTFNQANTEPELVSFGIGQITGTAIRTLIGLGVALLFFIGYRRFANPNQFLGIAELKSICEETATVSTVGVTSDNFYASASNREIIMFYQKQSVRNDEEKFKQLIFEARNRAKTFEQDGAK